MQPFHFDWTVNVGTICSIFFGIWGFQNIANTHLIASSTTACDVEYFRVGGNAQ